jgi:hypothetical protein
MPEVRSGALAVRWTVLVTFACILALAPARALAASTDASATRTYLKATYVLVRVATDNIGDSERQLSSLAAQVRGECPDAAAGSPQDQDSEQLSDEVIGGLVLAGTQPDLGAIESFIGVAGRLHWSNRRLTDSIHAYVRRLQAFASLAAPSLCSDVKAWAAGGYRSPPATAVTFDAQFIPVWVSPGDLPPGLRRFEAAGQRSLARAIHELETLIAEYETRAQNEYDEILDALELKQ